MTLTEQFEQDRDRLLADLEGAGDPVRAQAVLGSELDRILFRYNEECRDDRLREAASYMIQTARMALSLTDAAGDVRIWERLPDRKEDRGIRALSGLALILLIAGAACGVLAAAGIGGKLENGPGPVLVSAAFAAAAIVLSWLSGWLHGKPEKAALKKKGGSTGTSSAEHNVRKTEISVDPQKLYRSVHGVLLTIDRNLEDIRSAGNWERRQQAGQASRIEGRTLELCASLLEAAASGDGEYALERIEDVKYFLHEKGIEAVMYSGEHEDWFDILPGTKTGTIRPALTEEGVLLKKGLATAGRS